MNDSSFDNLIVSIPVTDVVEEIPVDTAIDVLEKEVSASVGVNDVVSKKKKRKPKRSSSECGVNYEAQDNNVSVSIPETDVVEEVPSNLANFVVEKEVSGGMDNVVSKKKKRKPKRSSSEYSVNSGAQDNVSVSIPETDVVKEVPANLTTSVSENDGLARVDNVVSKKKRKPKRNSPECGVNSIEKDNVSVSIPETDVLEKVPSNLRTSVLENDVSGEVNNVVSKKKKRKRSTVGVLEREILVGVNVVEPKGSCVEMTCLDNVSVGIPKADVIEEVAVQSNLTSSGEELHISPVDTIISVLEKDVSAFGGVNNVVSKRSRRKRKKEVLARVNSTMGVLENEVSAGVKSTMGVLENEVPASGGVNSTMGVLEKEVSTGMISTMGLLENEVSAGVNDVVSKKRKRKPKRLDNASVGIPKTNVLEEVPLQSNLTSSSENFHIPPVNTTMGVLEKEVPGAGNVVVSMKEKRKPKRSSIEMTCLDNVNVGIPKTKGLEEVPAQLNLTNSCEKLHISPVDTTTGVLEKEVSAGVNDVVSKKTKRKAKRKEMDDYGSIERTCLDNASVGAPKTDVLEEVLVESNLTSSREEFHISPIVTTMGALDKEVSASAGVNEVVSKRRRRKLKRLDNVSVGTPKTDVVEEVPVGSSLTCSPEKLHISAVDTTMDVLEKEVSGRVNVLESKKRKRKPKLCSSKCGEKSVEQEMNDHSLDNASVSITKVDVLEEVPVQSNLTSSPEKFHISPVDTTMCVLEKEVSGGVDVLVSKKRKRKSKLKEMNDCSSIERTCLDNVSVRPVSGVTDNISVYDINNDVMASDHPVVTCSVNVGSNGKPEEAKDVGVIPSKKSKRKHRSCSSSEVINPSLQLSQPLDTTTILKSRKKLLVLDVNGLLADIVPQCPKRFKPDFTLAKKIVFKRPFCDDFLQFCFEKFNVGIWSSRTKKNLTRAVDLLMNNLKDKLRFCWDGSRCTKTGFKTLEDKHKPLVLKELKRLWEDKVNCLPSQRGFYNASNTILLDDSPYKALRNPPYTAIHPRPYSFADVGDKSLGPDGDLRLYLERLAEAENVQNFIYANPFGQKPITQSHPSWKFYSKIVRNPARKGNSYYQRP